MASYAIRFRFASINLVVTLGCDHRHSSVVHSNNNPTFRHFGDYPMLVLVVLSPVRTLEFPIRNVCVRYEHSLQRRRLRGVHARAVLAQRCDAPGGIHRCVAVRQNASHVRSIQARAGTEPRGASGVLTHTPISRPPTFRRMRPSPRASAWEYPSRGCPRLYPTTPAS